MIMGTSPVRQGSLLVARIVASKGLVSALGYNGSAISIPDIP